MQSQYLVGTATADITPSLDRTVYLAGFAPGRTARSVLHPLEAGVLYVADEDGEELCLVTLDLIGVPRPWIMRMRQACAATLPPERIIIASTHTHSGPDTLGLWGKAFLGMIPIKSGVDAQYMETVVSRVAAVVARAHRNAAPATLEAVTYDAPAGWVRNDRKGGAMYPRTTLLAARREGEVKAVLFNFGSHPEALWEKNRDVSPDYPAPLRNRLRERGVETPLFFTAPLGAMLTPDVPPKAKLAARREYIENMGRALADSALDNLAGASPLEGPVRLVETDVTLPNANPRFEFAKKRGLIDRPMDDGNIVTSMAAGSIGSFQFVTVPGEPSPEVGHQVHAVMTGEHRAILCLGLDELGYIIPASFFTDKEYKYEKTMSVGSHTAPTVVQTTRYLMERLNS